METKSENQSPNRVGRTRRVLGWFQWEGALLKNHLIISIRNLRRQAVYSWINIGGLAVGLATCFVIFLFVRYELSYDRFHEKAARIYRVVQQTTREDSEHEALVHPAPLAPVLIRDIPAIEDAVRLADRLGEVLVKRGPNAFYDDGFYFIDRSFFSVFTASVLQGNPLEALDGPFTAVISRSTSQKYFGTENPIGKTLTIEGRWGAHDYEVTAVARDYPPNSHFQFNFLTSLETLRAMMPTPENMDLWVYNGYYTYVVLRAGTSPESIERDLTRVLSSYNARYEEMGIAVSYRLQPLTDIHLYSHLDRELRPNGDAKYLYIFTALALLILIVACINYVNLSTARSARRAREVGVRKVVGAWRTQLIRQFLCESLVLGGIALLLAGLLLIGFIPIFNFLSGKTLAAAELVDPGMVIGLFSAGLFVSLAAGLYPAFVLSHFEPIRAIRGRIGTRAGSKSLRRSLVVAQFAISFALIAGTLVIYRQLEFMQEKKLGFNEDRVVVVDTHQKLGRQFGAFRTELLKNPGIESVTATEHNSLPVQGDVMGLRPEGFEDSDVRATTLSVGPHFLKTLEIPLLAGSDLPQESDADGREFTPVLINDAAARAFGWEEPIGKTFACCWQPTPKVVGVVEDFHFRSIRESIGPLAIMPTPWASKVLIRAQGEDIRAAVNRIQADWEAFAPGTPFDYHFLDAQFDALYRSEEQLGRVFGAFAVLAIFVACMGLFGLATFMAESRTKEIGIRRVLGATAASIMGLLSREIVILVGVALLIGTPLVWAVSRYWLQEFAYTVDLGPGIFLLAGGAAVAIAMLTVSHQAIKAAFADPVRALRYE